MLKEQEVSGHYTHGNLLQAIEAALPALGRTKESVTVDDLAPVDEFHVGGRVATKRFLEQLQLTEQDYLLDVGCGLGGASRFAARQFGSRVTGLDLTQEYVDTGNALSIWVGLSDQVRLHQGSALTMPFDANSFDAAYMLHVGMNIAEKGRLFAEISRVLKPSGILGVYDIMQTNPGDLAYPVPWATVPATSKLETPEHYREAMRSAGFELESEENRRDFALAFFEELKTKTQNSAGPPPLGLHTLMGATTPAKVQNMIANISNGYLAPVELIGRNKKES